MSEKEEGRIAFRKTVSSSEFLCPPSFDRDVHYVEYREDPLTKVPCRINVRRGGRLKGTPPRESEDWPLDDSSCPFCADNIETLTTKFAPEFFPGGRMSRGDSVLFPNLFPLAERHAIAVLTRRHFVKVGQFTERELTDNVHLAKEYLQRICLHDASPWYPIYLWNHLPSSAASMVHPHVQILVDRWATPYQERLLNDSGAYFYRTGTNYWQDLVEKERELGERLIMETGLLAVVATYAPQGNREVTIVFKRDAGLLDLHQEELAEMAACVVKLLRGYGRMGVNSFNLCTFCGPIGEPMPYYRLHAKLIARPVYRAYYRNDTGVLERFHYEADIETTPETFAQEMRSCMETG